MLELLITAVAILIAAGLIIWLVDRFLPIDPSIKNLIRVVIIVGVVIYLIWMLLQVSGVLR